MLIKNKAVFSRPGAFYYIMDNFIMLCAESREIRFKIDYNKCLILLIY